MATKSVSSGQRLQHSLNPLWRASIQKVVVQNFRCFVKQEWHLFPGLNILQGDTNTGKTSLIEALMLGLGGDEFLKEELFSYIRKGEVEALVRVVLSNIGPNSFRPEIFGSSITFDRIIRAKPVLRIIGDSGEVVAVTGEVPHIENVEQMETSTHVERNKDESRRQRNLSGIISDDNRNEFARKFWLAKKGEAEDDWDYRMDGIKGKQIVSAELLQEEILKHFNISSNLSQLSSIFRNGFPLWFDGLDEKEMYRAFFVASGLKERILNCQMLVNENVEENHEDAMEECAIVEKTVQTMFKRQFNQDFNEVTLKGAKWKCYIKILADQKKIQFAIEDEDDSIDNDNLEYVHGTSQTDLMKTKNAVMGTIDPERIYLINEAFLQCLINMFMPYRGIITLDDCHGCHDENKCRFIKHFKDIVGCILKKVGSTTHQLIVSLDNRSVQGIPELVDLASCIVQLDNGSCV